MTRSLLTSMIALSLAAPCAAQDRQPRVFVVGDSHVFALGPALSNLLEEDGVEVEGWESRHGWSTARYQEANDLRALLEHNGSPEIVVVSLGGNDIVRSRESYERQLGWVVAQARAAGAQEIVWLGPATSDGAVSDVAAATGERHERNAQLQSEILPELGVHWIDSRPVTHEHHRGDGVHFTRDGYHLWACGVCNGIVATVDLVATIEEA
jgi:lysophospholipase L1-like esterase